MINKTILTLFSLYSFVITYISFQVRRNVLFYEHYSHSNSKIVYSYLNQIHATDQQQHEEYTVIYRVTDIIVAHVSMFQKIVI